MKSTTITMSTLVVLFALLLCRPTLATEVLINSGRNGESTSQTSAVTEAAATSDVSKSSTTTESLVTTTMKAAAGDNLDLDKAETKDPTKKLEIIKQIRKINKDGSYTVGYEAGDGTFKIESRDVLGNIKGTYGYVDANGEIKRVSYNGNNSTTSALKSFPNEVATDDDELRHNTNNHNHKDEVEVEEQEELSTTLPNVNAAGPSAVAAPAAHPPRTTLRSMRRPPSLKFLSTTPASLGPKSNYIQTIPKRRLAVPSSTERSQYSHYATAKTTDRPPTQSSTRTPVTGPAAAVDEQQTPTTIVYARTVPTQKPLIILRPTTQATSTSHTQEQISRPDKLEINHVSKVMVMKSSDASTSKSEKDGDRKSIRGNNLRRQLAQEREDHYEAQPQHLYAHNAGEDSQHIYDGTTGNLRPLYSTTSRPRVPSIVLAARQRAAQLQNALNSNSAPTTTTEKVYVRPPPAAVQYETTTSEPAQETNYLTQSPSGTVVQIPANQGIAQQATEDQGSIYGQRPAPFALRHHQGAQGPYQGTEPPNSLFRFPPPPSARGDQFLRETTPSSSASKHREDGDEPIYGRQSQQRPRGGSGYEPDAGYQQGSFPVPFQQGPYGFYPGPPQNSPYNFPQRPVTTRDFEMLLQLLVNRQTPRFGGFGGGYGGGYGGFNPGVAPYLSNPYQGFQQYPRSQLYDPVGFDPRYGYQNNFGGFRQYSEQQNSIYPGQGGQGAADPSQQQQQQQPQSSGPFPYDSQRGLATRQRQFGGSNYFGQGSASAAAANPYQQPQQRGGFPQQPFYQPQPDFSNVQQSYATQASTQQDYLPSEVREDLLYRMLMLAIQNPGSSIGGGAGGGGAGYESHHHPQIGAFSDPIKSVVNTVNGSGVASVPNPVPVHSQQHLIHLHNSHRRTNNNEVQTATRKPVRSVQILGEAEE